MRRADVTEGGREVIKKEIKHLKLKVGEYENISVSVPASVMSALAGEGLIREPYFGVNAEQLRSVASLGATFSAEFEMDTVMLAQDSLVLRFHGVDAPLVLSVNGIPIAGLENSHVVYDVDIKSRVHIGKNTLTLRFAPRPNMGEYIKDIAIFAPIELIAYSKAVIDDVAVSQRFEGDSVRLSVKMTTKGYALKQNAVAVLVAPSGAVSYSTLSGGVGEMRISNPNLWRPGRLRGHRLYRLTLNLYSDTVLVDSREFKVGLRSVERTEGRSPELSVCGSPYSPVAVRYSTADLIKPRATEARVELMLRRAADAGIDMIYVDSEDAYPSEHFLTCCDELGLALAVEAIVSDAPRSALTDQLAEKDIARSLRRLAMHPSVMLLVGGGEYSDVVEKIAADILPDTLYVSRAPRICDAIPSLPADPTSRAYFGEDDMNLNSRAITARGCAGVERLMRCALAQSRIPHSFAEWSYLSAVLSAEQSIASLRSFRSESAGVFECIEDLTEPLPSISCSVLDYQTRAKAVYYYLKRETAERSLYAALSGTEISFNVANKETNVYKARLNYAVLTNDNRVVVRDSVEIEAAAESVSCVYAFDAAALISGHENEYYLSYSLTDARGTHSRGTMLFVPPRLFEFKKPSITAEISGSGTDYAVTLYSDVYARAVEVYIDGEEDVILEDNFVDITSDVAVRLRLTTLRPTAIETLKRELRVRSFYDVGR